jgi:DNA-binding CsgD family transcriptional regulator
MELIERAAYLEILQRQLVRTATGEGYTIFLAGEAGIGKTSLVKTFIKECEPDYEVFLGSCDSLFTPRPLAPLYDIALKAGKGLQEVLKTETDKATLFTAFFQRFHASVKPLVVVFEDIHWADEATLDFIKFFARRIAGIHCLFILTLRDNEINTNHALRNVLGDLSPDITRKITLQPLSKGAVEKMAAEKGYSGEDVYKISGGIPFYVNEILASYSHGIPENIKDAVLAVFNKHEGQRKELWELFSVIPDGLEFSLLPGLGGISVETFEQCLNFGIFVTDDKVIRFKHELYRRTIEESLSPLKRITLNKTILDLLLNSPVEATQPERIVHYAKNAHAYNVVMQYAPVAAAKAAKIGAHTEAARLYLTAIEFSPTTDRLQLVELYEKYAYECYLVNQHKESIIYLQKALAVWKAENETEKTGNCLRFLSRVWWFEGNKKESEKLGTEAVAVMEYAPVSAVKAMVYSNMSQLRMLADDLKTCVYWGNMAIEMAKELKNDEILSHALCNVGSVTMKVEDTYEEGEAMLRESLAIALQHGYQEHVGRAYTNLGANSTVLKKYSYADQVFKEGIDYCNEQDLDSWSKYMLSWSAWIKLDTGYWQEAASIASKLIKNERNIPVTTVTALFVLGKIKTRRGEVDALDYLQKAKALAFPTGEQQRIAPVMAALLEYEWHTGERVITDEMMEVTLNLLKQGNPAVWSEFICWLFRARNIVTEPIKLFGPYSLEADGKIHEAIQAWRNLHCPYEEAFALFNGDDEDKRKALDIIHQLGAVATWQKMKQSMRSDGIRNIPRGIRESTKSNPAQLTNRQVDVLKLLNDGLQNKEIADKLFISAKTVDHHISAILFKLDVNSRNKAVTEAIKLGIIK